MMTREEIDEFVRHNFFSVPGTVQDWVNVIVEKWIEDREDAVIEHRYDPDLM